MLQGYAVVVLRHDAEEIEDGPLYNSKIFDDVRERIEDAVDAADDYVKETLEEGCSDSFVVSIIDLNTGKTVRTATMHPPQLDWSSTKS